MKIYLVHCGFYDLELCDGLYESHVNFFVAAADVEQARLRAKALPEFKSKRMHVDGLQELSAVEGFRIELKEEAGLEGKTILQAYRHRDLAPKPAVPAV